MACFRHLWAPRHVNPRIQDIRSKEHDTKVETAKRLLTIGKLSFEEIAIGSGLSLEDVEELAGMQLA